MNSTIFGKKRKQEKKSNWKYDNQRAKKGNLVQQSTYLGKSANTATSKK